MKFADSGLYACVWDTEDDTLEYVTSIGLEDALHLGITIDNFGISNDYTDDWRDYLNGKLLEFNKYPIKILSNDNILIVWCNDNAVISEMLVDYNFEFYIDASEEKLIVYIDAYTDTMSICLGLNDEYCKLGVRGWAKSRHFRASWNDTLKKGVLL